MRIDRRIDRDMAAKLLEVHPDTLTDRLRVDAALQGCLLERGGRGKRQYFDVRKLFEYDLAKRNPHALAAFTLDRLEDPPIMPRPRGRKAA